MVGATGFEPATSSPPVKRATKLRYSPYLRDVGAFLKKHPLKADRVGFEPTVQENPYTAFPMPLLQPLGHLSGRPTSVPG